MRTLAALLLMGLAGPALAAEPPAGDATRGRRIAAQYCASCHAIGQTGASQHAEAPAFRSLHERYPVDDLAEALAEGIVSGHPDMPEMTFTPQEIADLLAYLHTLER